MSDNQFGELWDIEMFDNTVDADGDPIYEFFVLDMSQLHHAIDCHNTLLSLNPDAVREVVEAAKAIFEHADYTHIHTSQAMWDKLRQIQAALKRLSYSAEATKDEKGEA